MMEFVTLTRGGSEGVIAIIAIDGEHKYFERIGLESILESLSNPLQSQVIKQALYALDSIKDLDEIPEFQGGLPVQESLFN